MGGKDGVKPSLHVDVKAEASVKQAHAKQLCIHLLEDWSGIGEDAIQVDLCGPWLIGKLH